MAFVVFAGQSNTGGTFMDASTLPAPWVSDPLTLIWDKQANAFVQMQPGVNTGFGPMPNAWGPEMQFAVDFRAKYPGETLYIVKDAEGGTALAVDPVQWHYDWSPQSNEELFDRTAQTIAKASQALGGAKPTAVFWGQGEEDGSHWDSAQAYDDNLPALFSAVRAEWMGDAAGKIGFFRIYPGVGFASDVRAAQLATDQADPNADSFDTAGFPMQNDSVHYAAAGYQMVGAGYFDLYEAWRSGAPVGGGSSGTPTSGSDNLQGGAANDTILGGLGDDTITDVGGSNYLRGNEGRDQMTGGSGFDDIHGNQGDDTVRGGAGDDWVVGGQDNDVLFGDDGHDVVYGNLGNDTLTGGTGNDWVRGGQGDDLMTGSEGDDWLSGDRGADTMSGGSGADIFNTFGEAGLDRVTDFAAWQGDRVKVEAGYTYSAEQVGADTVVSVSGGAQMVLVGVNMASLSAGWIFSG